MFLFLFTFLSLAHGSKQIINQPLDFNLQNKLPANNQIIYGYSNPLFSWQDWLARRSSGPLLIPLEPPLMTLEVFEARSAGIVRKPISFFTKELLNNIETLRVLYPKNSHKVLPSNGKFTTETTIPFPRVWSQIIFRAKQTGFLAEKTTDNLVITSEHIYLDCAHSPPNPARDNLINLLNIYKTKPDVINMQGLVRVNQIAKFGSLISFFYGIDANQTLVVNYFALGIKKRELDKGISGMNVRSILMGENVIPNSNEGIGQGLPKYVENLLGSMYEVWN